MLGGRTPENALNIGLDSLNCVNFMGIDGQPLDQSPLLHLDTVIFSARIVDCTDRADGCSH